MPGRRQSSVMTNTAIHCMNPVREPLAALPMASAIRPNPQHSGSKKRSLFLLALAMWPGTIRSRICVTCQIKASKPMLVRVAN